MSVPISDYIKDDRPIHERVGVATVTVTDLPVVEKRLDGAIRLFLHHLGWRNGNQPESRSHLLVAPYERLFRLVEMSFVPEVGYQRMVVTMRVDDARMAAQLLYEWATFRGEAVDVTPALDNDDALDSGQHITVSLPELLLFDLVIVRNIQQMDLL